MGTAERSHTHTHDIDIYFKSYFTRCFLSRHLSIRTARRLRRYTRRVFFRSSSIFSLVFDFIPCKIPFTVRFLQFTNTIIWRLYRRRSCFVIYVFHTISLSLSLFFFLRRLTKKKTPRRSPLLFFIVLRAPSSAKIIIKNTIIILYCAADVLEFRRITRFFFFFASQRIRAYYCCCCCCCCCSRAPDAYISVSGDIFPDAVFLAYKKNKNIKIYIKKKKYTYT